MNIPIAKTVFTEKEFDAIRKPLETGWVVQGPAVAEFEKLWSEFTGVKNSIAVTSCTTALHLSLAALDIQPNDEIILPSFTWIATANAVEYINSKPILCDINLDTFNINPADAENKITKKTKAIIPVHLFGLSAPMDEITGVAKKNNLSIVEDAACGFASRYKNKHVGNLGNTACFSFHPRKAITTGEGGMITTDDDNLAAKMRSMRDHGATVSDHQRHFGNKPYLLSDYPYLGYNYRMTDIQASIGVTQMQRAKEIHESRSRIASKYDEALQNIQWLQLPFKNKDYVHGYQAYVCLFKPEEINLKNIDKVNEMRNKFMEFLQQKGISTRPGTHSVHLQVFYSNKYGFKPEDFPNSYIADRCSIAFPLYPSMSDKEFDYVCDTINSYKI